MLLSFSGNRTTMRSQVFSQVYLKNTLLVKHAFPTSSTRGERQHREETTHWRLRLHVNNWKEKAILLLQSLQKSARHLGLRSESNGISFREVTDSWWDSSLLGELLSSLPESSKYKFISFFCQREIQLLITSPGTAIITWLHLMADNSNCLSL